MRLAQIVNGTVKNIIKVDPDNVPEWAVGWPEATENARIGGGYDGVNWTPAPVPEPKVVPPSPLEELLVILVDNLPPGQRAIAQQKIDEAREKRYL